MQNNDMEIEYDEIDGMAHEDPTSLREDTLPLVSKLQLVNYTSIDNASTMIMGSEVEEAVTLRQTFKDVAKLIGPVAAAQFIAMLGEILLVKISSQLGEDDLAATALIFTSQAIFINAPSNILVAGNILAGGAKANMDQTLVGKIYRQTMVLSGLLSIPMVGIAYVIKPILTTLGQDPGLSEICQDFFNTRAIGIPFLMMLVTNQQISLGVGNSRITTASIVVNSFSTYLLGNLFALGALGFPKMGIQGLGLAIAGASTLSLLSTFVGLAIEKEFQSYQLFNLNFDRFTHMKKLLKKGTLIVLQAASELININAATLMIGLLGTESLLAQQVVVPYYSFFSVPYIASSQAIMGSINELMKRRQYTQLNNYVGAASVLCLTSSTIGMILFCSMPMTLASTFINTSEEESETLKMIKALFIINGVELIFDTMKNIYTGALRGMNENRYPTTVSVISTTVSLSLGYVLGFPLKLGVKGIFIARDAGIVTSACMLYNKWLKKKAEIATERPALAPAAHSPSISNSVWNAGVSFFSGAKMKCQEMAHRSRACLTLTDSENREIERGYR